MKLTYKTSLLIALPVSLLLMTTSCKKDKIVTPEENPPQTDPTYNVPTTYNFASVDFTTSTQRISMLSEMTGYIRVSPAGSNTPLLFSTGKNYAVSDTAKKK